MDEVRLRKLDFPQSAKECLAQLDKFLSRNPTIPTGRMSKDLQSALDEHLYCISDRRGSFCLRLSCLQDLQLLLLLLNHYGTKSEADTRSRQILFEILFCPRDADGPFFDHRVKLLFRLVSLALQLHCAPLLADFALWIQKSKNLIHLVPLSAVLIEDFCATGQTFTVDRNHLYSAFYEVITICPTFAFVSFAAVCKGSQRRQFPTQPLMEILTEWLSSPKPLIKAFKDASKEIKSVNGLFDGISLTVVTLMWTCCVGPVHSATTDFQRQLFFKLHAVLLQFIILLPKSSTNVTLVEIRGKDIVDILESLNEIPNVKEHPNLPICLDRLTMAVQIAISSGCFVGSKKDIEKNFSFRFQHESFQKVLMLLP